MEIGHTFKRVRASEAFVANIAALWQATPAQAVRQVSGWGWRVVADTYDDARNGLALGDICTRRRCITYYEYHAIDGRRERAPLDTKTHYHELVHVMDHRIAIEPALNEMLLQRSMSAFTRDHGALSPAAIAQHAYFLSYDRPDEPAVPGRTPRQHGLIRAHEETRAEAAAEYIVDGQGPIMELMPQTLATVVADIRLTMPSLLDVVPRYRRPAL